MLFNTIWNILFGWIQYLLRFWSRTEKINPSGKYVLISGCDTGIGYSLTIKLDQLGFNVIATVLYSENIAKLKAKLSSNAIIMRLDITKQEDIDEVYEQVRRTTSTLYGLVNNAGIITHGCIDWTSLEMMRQVMKVNFFGHVAMTKTFLPLLIVKRDSRVVNMGSATGFFAFPQTSAYSASKHALRAFSDCLRREMIPWGLRVSIIEPGTLRTKMLEGFADRLKQVWRELPEETQRRWGTNYLEETIKISLNSPFMTHPDHPYRVVECIIEALISIKPRRRYQPGWQSKIIFYILYLLPTCIVDRILDKACPLTPDGLINQRIDA